MDHDSTKVTKVAVLELWLMEHDFADFPLARLVRLQDALSVDNQANTPACFGGNGQNQEKVRFKIVGRRSLDMQKRMDEELKNREKYSGIRE